MAPMRFSAPKREPEPPIQFEVAYQRHHRVSRPRDGEPELVITDEVSEFQALPKSALPAGVLLDYARGIRVNEDGRLVGDVGVSSLVDFIRGCLLPEDEPRWNQLTHDKEIGLRLDLVIELAMWLNEQYGERPTKPSSDLPTGSQQPGSGPTEQPAATA